MKLFAIPVLLAAALIATPAQAKLRVFACEPEWASLVHELAGDKVDVDVAVSYTHLDVYKRQGTHRKIGGAHFGDQAGFGFNHVHVL